MKQIKLLMLLLLIIIASFSIQATFSLDTQELVNGINSTSDLTQALEEAGNTNKSVLLIFDQASCYYCDLLKSNTLSDANVQKEINEKYIVVDVDVNKEASLAAKYQVVGTPMIIILDSNGNQQGKIEGYVDANEFLAELKEI